MTNIGFEICYLKLSFKSPSVQWVNMSHWQWFSWWKSGGIAYKHMEAATRWRPFRRWHFQTQLLKWKSMNLIEISLKLLLSVQLTKSDNQFVPNRRQVIIWTNGGLVYWCIYASLGLNKLRSGDAGEILMYWVIIGSDNISNLAPIHYHKKNPFFFFTKAHVDINDSFISHSL